jgi:hypothetical protein
LLDFEQSRVDRAIKSVNQVLYGTANGFGWKLNDVIGAQSLVFPRTYRIVRPMPLLNGLSGGWAAIFGVLLLLVNLAFYLFSRRVVPPSQPPGPANEGQAP